MGYDVDEFLNRFEHATHDALREAGLRVRFSGPTATLEVDGHTLQRPWIAQPRLARAGWAETAGREQPSLLLVEGRLPESAARRARERGDWYLDTHGNAYIRAPGVLVDVRGRRAQRSPDDTPLHQHARGTNLMSARRAQVIFALLTWPSLLQAPLRALADAAGVSVSMAHNTKAALEEERYLIPGAANLDRRDVLIDQWANAFPLGLGSALELGRFVGEMNPEDWRGRLEEVYVSGEQAIGTLRGGGLTLYMAEQYEETLWRFRWRRAASDEHANIIIRRKFWTAPWYFHEWDGPNRTAPGTAPPLLVYADLLASREPRQLEAAGLLRKRIVED